MKYLKLFENLDQLDIYGFKFIDFNGYVLSEPRYENISSIYFKEILEFNEDEVKKIYSFYKDLKNIHHSRFDLGFFDRTDRDKGIKNEIKLKLDFNLDWGIYKSIDNYYILIANMALNNYDYRRFICDDIENIKSLLEKNDSIKQNWVKFISNPNIITPI